MRGRRSGCWGPGFQGGREAGVSRKRRALLTWWATGGGGAVKKDESTRGGESEWEKS